MTHSGCTPACLLAGCAGRCRHHSCWSHLPLVQQQRRWHEANLCWKINQFCHLGSWGYRHSAVKNSQPHIWHQSQINCCCLLSVTGYIMTWCQQRGDLRTCSTAFLGYPYKCCICVWCSVQWLPVLEVMTSDSPVTQGPSIKVPSHSCWKGYNLQAFWAEAEFGKNLSGSALRKQ